MGPPGASHPTIGRPGLLAKFSMGGQLAHGSSLCGAFLPSFLTEGIPYLNLAPFWTLAVALATRGRGGPELPLPPRVVN
jgi:hypothetical protein